VYVFIRFTQLFFESRTVGASQIDTKKHNLTRNSQSRSFKVMHFGITEKPTTDCVSLYNNAGLISKVSEEIASENTENCRCRQPNCRLTSPPQGISTNIRTSLISPETKSHRSTFVPLTVWVYLHSFFVVGSERRIFSAIECVSAVQGHPKLLILAPIERAYATSC